MTQPVTFLHAASTAGPVSCPASGNTALLTVDTSRLDRIFVQFSVATQALDAFIIQGRCSADAAFETLYSTAAHYNTPTGLLVGTSGDLTAVAAGSTGWFILDTSSLYEVKILASGAVNNAAVTIYAGGL